MAGSDDNVRRFKQFWSKSMANKVAVVATPIAVAGLCGSLYLGTHQTTPVPQVDQPLATATVDSDAAKGTVLASYTYDGETKNVTQADVSDYMGKATTNDDGTTDLFSADYAMTVIRQRVLDRYCEQNGIGVTGDEISDYAKNTYGTDDVTQIAKGFNTDADTMQKSIEENARINKLHTQVTDFDLLSNTFPTAPSQDEGTDYKAYIESIGQSFDGNTATYDDANSAFQKAYSDYSKRAAEANEKWNDFANGLYSKCAIVLYTAAQ